MTDKEYYLGSDGNLEHYPQIYKDSPADLAAAEKLEQYILSQQQNIEASFLKMGAALNEFEKQKLYLARGVPSFRIWVTEYCHFSYEHATRLIRIVRDLVPVLGETESLPPVSTLKEMLPMLSEGKSPEQIREVLEEVQDLTTKDAKKRIRELRGLEETDSPVIFKARVTEHADHVSVEIMKVGGDHPSYSVTPKGPMYIRKEDWPRMQDRFGFAVEFVT